MTVEASNALGEHASSRPGDMLLLFTLAIGFVMAMIDLTAVNVALPDISLSLSVPLTGLIWVVDGYTLTFAALLLAGGALADRFGPKKAYQSGLVVFILGSVLCGLAPSGGMLIGARLLQGAGAALFMPSSLSLLAQNYSDDLVRAKMVSIWSAMVGASSAIGPLVGGSLIQAFGWRSVFWINVPIGILGMVLAQVLIKATPKHDRALSLYSHGLGVVALAALSYFLIEGPALGWLSAPVLSAAVIAAISVLLLLWRERNGGQPLLPRALVQTHGFAAISVVGFLINFGAFGQLFLLSLYFQQARMAAPMEAGLQLLPMMAAITAGNLLSGKVSAKIGTRRTMLFGLAFAVVLGVAMMAMRLRTPDLVLTIGTALMNLSVGTAIPAMTTTMMMIASRAYANSAAAALNANRQVGALVGVAVIGTVLHSTADWDMRLPLSFLLIAAVYGGACLLVLWRINRQ